MAPVPDLSDSSLTRVPVCQLFPLFKGTTLTSWPTSSCGKGFAVWSWYNFAFCHLDSIWLSTPSTTRGRRRVEAVGIRVLVLRDIRLCARLDPTASVGVFRYSSRASQGSLSSRNAFFIKFLVTLTAASAFPLDLWWWGEEVTLPFFGNRTELMARQLRSIVLNKNIRDSMSAELFLQELYNGCRCRITELLNFHEDWVVVQSDNVFFSLKGKHVYCYSTPRAIWNFRGLDGLFEVSWLKISTHRTLRDCFLYSLLIPGQKTTSRAFLRQASIPRWLAWLLRMISDLIALGTMMRCLLNRIPLCRLTSSL